MSAFSGLSLGLLLLLTPLASAETFEQQLSRELSEGMDGQVILVASGCATDPSYGAGCGGGYPQATTSTPEIDYNYGYGTRTDVYLRGDGQIQVYEHMSSGPDDEVRVYDWQNQESAGQGRQLQPGVRRLWGE